MKETDLGGTALFRGISPEELPPLLACMEARRQTYEKGERVLCAGDTVTGLGLVLSGRVLIEKTDLWGNTAVLDSVGPGQIFAETYACTPGEPLMVDVTAPERAEVLFLSAGRVLSPCGRGCGAHSRLIRSLLALSAQKNLRLSRKIFHTAPKTIRGRLLTYLSDQALRAGSRSFTVPFDRQQLADYLNVDRSALSAEIGKLRREGVLLAERNRFTILGDGPLP